MVYNNQYPTRKAVLIGCPGEQSRFLKGVSYDLENMKRFLLSEKGGSWHQNEIVTLYNPTFDEVFSAVHGTKADYEFTYFSGHGYTSTTGERMLVLSDYVVKDTFLLNYSLRQFIACDSCRDVVGATISGVPDWEDQYFPFDGLNVARELFDECILNSAYGKLIIHGTQNGESSFDSSKGGYFTRALLDVARSFGSDNYEPVSLNSILANVPVILRKQSNFQYPDIVYKDGLMNVPFAIALPRNIVVRQHPGKPKYFKENANTFAEGGGFVLLGLALIFIAASSK